MTDKKDKEMKIEFVPGCFDHFDGTQEELDKMVAEIQNIFSGKTREEIEEMSKPLDEESWDELPDDVKEQIINSFDEHINPKRNLQ